MSDGLENLAPASVLKTLSNLRRANESVTQQLRRNAAALGGDLLRREAEKRSRTSLDEKKKKAMRETATLAAASGTPEQAKAMLRKARGKLMNAAANGADTATLEGLVRDFERLAKTAEQKQAAEKATENARQKRAESA